MIVREQWESSRFFPQVRWPRRGAVEQWSEWVDTNYDGFGDISSAVAYFTGTDPSWQTRVVERAQRVVYEIKGENSREIVGE